jgi:hypothetical protein
MKVSLTVKLEESDARQLEAIAAERDMSRGRLVREAPGRAFAGALAGNRDAPWLRNGQGEHAGGVDPHG